jgi:hypothetical protein
LTTLANYALAFTTKENFVLDDVPLHYVGAGWLKMGHRFSMD